MNPANGVADWIDGLGGRVGSSWPGLDTNGLMGSLGAARTRYYTNMLTWLRDRSGRGNSLVLSPAPTFDNRSPLPGPPDASPLQVMAQAGGPYSAPEGTTITFDASGSIDANGGALQYRWDFESDGNWDTPWSSDPTATYVRGDDWTGTATVEVTDGTDTNADTASVTVNNLAPTAEDDTADVDEDQTLTIVAPGVLENDTDPAGDADPLTVTRVLTGPSHGRLTLNADGSGSYTPDGNYNGTDSFVYEISDGDGGVDTAIMTITVHPVNDAPMLADIPGVTFDEDGSDDSIDLDAYYSDVETLAGDATFEVVSAFGGVTATIDPVSHVLTIVGDADFNGAGDITIRGTDTGDGVSPALSAEDTLHVVVNSVNDQPSFVAGAEQEVDEDAGTQTVDGWATDIKPGPVNESDQAVSFVVTIDNADLFADAPAITPQGTLTYTPAPDANGQSTVTVVLKDDGGTDNGGVDESELQTFIITVNSVVDAVIDVKPGNGDELDPVNLGANGVLPMAILSNGSDQFDAYAVDIDSIRLNGKDVDARHVAFEDIDGDGIADLVLHFRISDIRDQGVFDPEVHDAQLLRLTAELEGDPATGPDLIGNDWIRLVPSKGKGKNGK